MLTLSEEKARARTAALERRSRAAAAVPDAAAALARHAADLPAAATVALYWPMRDEIDPRPLGGALAARGARLVLPVVRGAAMRFHPFDAEALVPGPFGTSEPAGGGPETVPDLLLVPLLAFDRAGHRLGYGKGCYDRWLAAHPAAHAVGVAFAAQEVDALPVEPHDVPLAAILTEREAIVAASRATA